jgi:predicted phosphodiesterase
MKLIVCSDLHLEFGSDFRLPTDGDVLILAGDIIKFSDCAPLDRLLATWKKPVLYIAGNHEYYTRQPMRGHDAAFRSWLSSNHPNVTFLQDEAITINGVHFFGGTMWTDFAGDPLAMLTAQQQMNDYRLILTEPGERLRPADTVTYHQAFKGKCIAWFEQDLTGPRVVITHTAPVINPNTKYRGSPLALAFSSLDMVEIVHQYQPDLWIYGHTHECDDHLIGKTRIVSNQRGYPQGRAFECEGFDRDGLSIEV